VREHLQEAKRAEHEVVAMRSALALVRALSEDAKRVRASLRPKNAGRAELQVEQGLFGTKESV
jgi:hypothetical protein